MRPVDHRPGELPDLAAKISATWRQLKGRRMDAVRAGRLVLPELTDAGLAALLNDLERLCAGRGLLPGDEPRLRPIPLEGAQDDPVATRRVQPDPTLPVGAPRGGAV